ncbi:hypothetical protein HELRODRAFT_170503 [Helobdella robusta]|uniref:Uncharacterized protein n=1 Tax=Helobdella robusta TaxID=6412 RepID=T1F350_HELRO|nr:hypothetical protein HELRODRAFT_170503 [Helobdella robusta]ESO07192.1 hypothetical protein HELRODRAFT_170503 [Helobdella robusta]
MYFFRNNIEDKNCSLVNETCKSYDIETKDKLAYSIIDRLVIGETDIPTNFDLACGSYLNFFIDYSYVTNDTSSHLLNAEANDSTINSGSFNIVADSTDLNSSFPKVVVTILKSNYTANFRLLELYAIDCNNSTCSCIVNITAANKNNWQPNSKIKNVALGRSNYFVQYNFINRNINNGESNVNCSFVIHNFIHYNYINHNYSYINPNFSNINNNYNNYITKIGIGVGAGALLSVAAFVLSLYCLKRLKVTKEQSVSYDNNSKNFEELNDNSTEIMDDHSESFSMEPTISLQQSFNNKYPISPVNESSNGIGKDKVNKYKAVRKKSSRNKTPLVGITEDFMQDSEIYYPLDDSTSSPNLQVNEVDGPISTLNDQHFHEKAEKLRSQLTKSFGLKLDYSRSLTDDEQILKVPSSPSQYQLGKQHFKKIYKIVQIELTNKQKVRRAKTFNLAGNYPQQMSYNGSFANASANAGSTGRDIDGNLLF